MSSYKKASVGIKELKDRASEIIAFVQRTGHTVSVTKNEKEVARIMPVPTDARDRLISAGLVQPGPKPLLLSELKLKRLTSDASPAIEAILRDREEK
jgi:prevent-host-death family protein